MQFLNGFANDKSQRLFPKPTFALDRQNVITYTMSNYDLDSTFTKKPNKNRLT